MPHERENSGSALSQKKRLQESSSDVSPRRPGSNHGIFFGDATDQEMSIGIEMDDTIG